MKPHHFKTVVTDPVTGNHRVQTDRAKTIPATKGITLTLTADHVRQSMKLGGVGCTQTCAMAVASILQANLFPHGFVGIIDWTFCRAFVASKLSKDGKPCECVVYEHEDEIARLNDSKNGQRKLLAMLERDGPKTIHLRPWRAHSPADRRTRTSTSGVRARTPSNGQGAAARVAFARQSGALKI